jgi:hypothetical protein
MELGPIRKELLAAFCILGEISEGNPTNWDGLIEWAFDFAEKLKKLKPPYTTLCEQVKLV